MPHVTFRISDAEADRLAKLTKRTGKTRSKVLKEMLTAEADRTDGMRAAPKVASKKELLELLTVRARAGSVTAIVKLLEKPWDKGKSTEKPATDGFEALDELAPRRRAG